MKRRLLLLAPIGAAAAAVRQLSLDRSPSTGAATKPAAAPAKTLTAAAARAPAPAPRAAPAPAPAQAASAWPQIAAVAEIKALRIPTGPYAGGYEIAPHGKLNWYFASLGLLPIVQDLSRADLDLHVRTYLDAYLRNLNPNLSIDDVEFPSGRWNTSSFVRVPSDSDDSYAATLLSLAAKYLAASGNRAWWDANKAKLKDLAYRNLALALKPNGLTSVFQAPRNETNSIGYLMDNCEVYRGLRDFSAALRSGGDAVDADYYGALAGSIGAGIGRLFNASANAFLPGDAYLAPETSFYAGTTCQVFPQAFGVSECAGSFDAAWQYLNRNSPNWQDGRYDAFPWAILGFVAAQRGQFAQATAQAELVQRMFSLNRERVTINELGFYQRIVNLLQGAADA